MVNLPVLLVAITKSVAVVVPIVQKYAPPLPVFQKTPFEPATPHKKLPPVFEKVPY